MKKAFTTMVVGGLLLGAAVPALAQEKPLGLSIRAGLFLPTDAGVKDASDAWVTAGVDYKFGGIYSAKGEHLGSFSLSLDYAGKAEQRIVPITLNYIARSHQIYGFVGAGVGFIRDNGADTTSFAYQGGIGYDFATGSTPVFLEAKYIGSSNQNVNGFGLYIGVRF